MPRFVKLALRQEGLSRKAKEEPKFKFYNLYGQVLLVDTLRCAWEQARANKGAAGVDHVAFEDVERSEGGVEGFLTSIQQELKAKTCRASPVKRVYIEKTNGKLRPLGIPTIKDRVVQAAVKLVIEPIFEADFHDCSYGFRPGRNAQIKEQTHSGRGLVPVEDTICAVNRIIDGWGRYFRCGSPAEMFGKVNEYVQLRMYIWLNRRSQRGYELKYAKTYYGELKHMGLISLTCKRYRQ